MKQVLAVAPQKVQAPTLEPKRFERLSLEGIDPGAVSNPVVKMLILGDTVLSSGRRCSIAPEDEWLIFLD